MLAISLAHVFFTGPLLVYIGVFQPSHPAFYHALLAFVVLIGLYFIYRITQVPITSPYQVWLLLHLLAFVPLLLWVAIRRQQAPRIVFSLLTAIGAAAIGYHLIRLAQRASILPSTKH